GSDESKDVEYACRWKFDAWSLWRKSISCTISADVLLLLNNLCSLFECVNSHWRGHRSRKDGREAGLSLFLRFKDEAGRLFQQKGSL
ncbi:hypothetical protein, partial [Paenibacillus sp. YN15]|uniref:hypothetical protein n=1 Tax=Paenibacillus sp. YN15 TaxID=1742774 RepID=UPI001C6576BA